jgi:hypothetical protein
MKILNRYIKPKHILRLLMAFSLVGILSIFLLVNRMNHLLNADVGFNKDSVNTIITHKSPIILPDTLVFSSNLPGLKVDHEIEVGSEFFKGTRTFSLQFISDSYFDFFNCQKLNEKTDLFLNHGNSQLVYINETAVKELGIYNNDDAPGTIFCSGYSEYVICGVVKNIEPLSIAGKDQAIIYQVTSEHLAYAFFDNSVGISPIEKGGAESVNILSFQKRIENHFTLLEDLMYSVFLFINVLIFLISLGYVGSKYAKRKDNTLYAIISLGINILTIILSKTYLYLIAILGFIAGPLSVLVHKFWLGVYENKVNFGFIDLFIFLSIALLAIYLMCCPKTKVNEFIKGKSIQVNSK